MAFNGIKGYIVFSGLAEKGKVLFSRNSFLQREEGAGGGGGEEEEEERERAA